MSSLALCLNYTLLAYNLSFDKLSCNLVDLCNVTSDKDFLCEITKSCFYESYDEVLCDFFMYCNFTSDGPPTNPFIPNWYLQLIYVIAFTVMVVVAAGGNLIVIWIVLAHKRMRTVTNYFLINLAIADVMISTLNTLFSFVYMLYSDWPFGQLYCKFTQFICPCAISASVLSFMAIAIDRYVAIIHPLRPRLAARYVFGIIAVIWVTSAAIASPNLVFSETHTWYFCTGDKRTVCYLNWPDGVLATTDFAYNLFIMFVNYFAPLSALAFTYIRVGRELWGSKAIGERTKAQAESVKSKRKVVKMMIVVVIIFAVCWLPQHIFFLITNRQQDINNKTYIQHVYLVIFWLAMSNSMYNPFVYCWMNARYRSGFKYVFRWLPCITWSSRDALGITRTSRTRGSFSEETKYTFYNDRNGTPEALMLNQLKFADTRTVTSHFKYRPGKNCRLNNDEVF